MPRANVVTMGANYYIPTKRYHMNSPMLNINCYSNNWMINSSTNIHVCANKSLFSN